MDFDPYRQWLSLDGQPSNFYMLLGLRPLESDTDLIQLAASQVISRVRNAKPGNQIGAWKQLLDQIEQARDSLCDPVKKQIYDQHLRNQIDTVDLSLSVSKPSLRSTQLSAMAKHVPDPMSPLDDADLPGTSPDVHPPTEPNESAPTKSTPGIRRNSVTSRHRSARRTGKRRKMRWAKPFTLVVSAVAFLAVAWALWFALQSNEQLLSFVFNGQPRSPDGQESVANPPTTSHLPPVSVDVTETAEADHAPPAVQPADELVASDTEGDQLPSQDQQREIVVTPAEAVEPMDTEDSSDEMEIVPPSIEELRQFGRHLQNARKSLSRRQFDESKEHLTAARKLGTTPELEAMVERLDTLHQYVHGYWMAVEDGMVDIENTELVVGGNRMFVVELTPDRIVLRVEGRNRRFDRNELPTKLAMALADRWFDQNASSTKVFKGAFMAVTPGYSEQQVRQLWQQAEREGTDLGDLTQVLDDRDWKP